MTQKQIGSKKAHVKARLTFKDQPIKLNLGCKHDIQKGYINIDYIQFNKYIYLWDLRNPLPYEDNSVEEIRALDLLEHFSWQHTEKTLIDWIRVLKPKGLITLKVPDLYKIIEYYEQGIADRRYSNGYDDAFEFLRANIFNGNHQTIFTPKTLKELLEKLSLKNIELKHKGRALYGQAVK